MDLAVIMPWIGAVISIITLLTLLKNMLSSGEKALDTRLTKAEDKLVQYDRRIQAIEGEMKHLPDRDSQHRIELNMEKINGRLDTLNETLRPIKANGELLNELLKEQAKAAGK